MAINIKQLVSDARAGDEKAYEKLLNRYNHGIYNMIYQMVKNRDETEDLVQETFIKAFNSLDSYNEQYAFSTWLYKIAFNNCIDSLRKRKLKTMSIDTPVRLNESEVQMEIKDDSESPEQNYIYNEKKKQIQDCIQSLPEKYRKTILLRHRDEKSYEEISTILNIPLGTVKARIFRAREMLKKKLKEI